MIYALFLLSIAPFLFCAAFVSHIKYFHDPETDFKISDLSFSPKKMGLLFSKTPNWVLHNSAFAFRLRAAEIGVYLLGPFVVTTGFYAFMQLYLNAVDNVDLQDSTIYQMHGVIVAIKARLEQLFFLRMWLLPLGIASLVLTLVFPLVYRINLGKRFSTLQAGIFRTYYCFTIFTIFTFFGAHEVARENNAVGDLAVQINQVTGQNQKIHREAKKAFAKQVAKSVGQAPDLENIYKEVAALNEKVNKKKPAGDDQAREKAANQYNAVLASLSSSANWEDILNNGIYLDDLDPDHINVTPPSNPKPPSGGNGAGGPTPQSPETGNVGANKAPTDINGANGSAPDNRPSIEQKASVSEENPNVEAVSEENIKVPDERPIESSLKHEDYFLPKEKGLDGEMSAKKAETILDDLAKANEALDVELSASESVALSATKKIANALVFDMFHQIKAAVVADPVLSVIADVLYLKALKPQLDQFVQDVFKGGIKMARSNLEGSESDKRASVSSKIKENQDLKDLRARMVAAEKTTAAAELKYAENIKNIEHAEQLEQEKIRLAEIKEQEAIRAKQEWQAFLERQEEAKIAQENDALREKIKEKINNLKIEVNSTGNLVKELRFQYPGVSDSEIEQVLRKFDNSYYLGKGIDNSIVRYQKEQYVALLTTVGEYNVYRENAALKGNLSKLSTVKSCTDLAERIQNSVFSIKGLGPICPRCGLPLSTPVCLARY